MCKNNSIDNIIKHFASFDTSQGSPAEIDTKAEYDELGKYLNGSIGIFTEEEGRLKYTNYTNLDNNIKNQLLNIMNNLKGKFGEWTNIFAPDAQFDEKNADLYVKRLAEYKLKLEELKSNKKEYTKYYKDNEKEIVQAENFVKEYCQTKGFKIKDYNIDNLRILQDLCQDRDKADELKKMLENKSEDFVITNNMIDYKWAIRKIFETEEVNNFTEEEINKLKQAVINYVKIYEDDITTDNIGEMDIPYILNQAHYYHEKKDTMESCNDKIQSVINNPYNKNNLKNTVKDYIKNNNIKGIGTIPDGVDIGNGKFDRTSTQKTENCWAHAGINSLLSSETGRQIVETNYFRDEKTGVIAIHLQEAEDMGLHGGIYVITPQEIVDSQTTLASGEGEISAYLIAIQKYFKEVNSNPELLGDESESWRFAEMDDGNVGFRFYEIMTGGKYTKWNFSDKDDLKVQNGIATSIAMNTEKLYNMVEAGDGAMTISLRGIAHNISIVGVKDGKFLIQESNNDETIFDNHVGVNRERIFTVEESLNGRPTFGISKEFLERYDLGAINYIKWK